MNLRIIAIIVMTLFVSVAFMPANASDFTLEIFGNANRDGTIDDLDIEYVKEIISGTSKETEFADANQDGKIDTNDISQIEMIMRGEQDVLNILDGNGKLLAVKTPVNRVIVEYRDSAELMEILDAEDKIIGVTSYISQWNSIEFPKLSKLPTVGKFSSLDYEAVLSLNPDLLLTFGAKTDEKSNNLPGVTVLFLGLYIPNLSDPSNSSYTNGVMKLGYILNKRNKAEEFIKWRLDWINMIKSRTENIADEDMPRIFNYVNPYEPKIYSTYSSGYKASQMSEIAGGKNIADDLPGFISSSAVTIELSPEWVIEQNPDIIVAQIVLEKVAHGYAVDNSSEMAALKENIMNRPELANINAIKTGKVFIMGDSFRNDATGYFIGAAYMGKWFYPDLFQDIDPQAIHQEYLTRFLGWDYDLDEHGVFVYPPLMES